MTRLRQGPGTEVLEREYIYSDPPISITDLAEKYGLARSGVADKARIGDWYGRRKAFREKVGDTVSDAMAEKWAEMQIAVYERLMRIGVKNLELYEQAIETGKIKPSTRDMIAIASMMVSLFDKVAAKPAGERSADPDEFDGDAEQARSAIDEVKRLMAGVNGGGE